MSAVPFLPSVDGLKSRKGNLITMQVHHGD
jgi:hypothetical protein